MKTHYDIIFIGGGLSASITAIGLLRELPKLKVLILERSEKFHKKVGETTADLSAIYLRRFKIDHLLKKHIQKTGLRFIFKDLDEFSGPSYKSIANGYQLNRQIFDEDLLAEAKSLGADVIRKAIVDDIDSRDFDNKVYAKILGDDHVFQSSWVIDASGRRAFAANKYGWFEKEKRLNTASSWAHFENVDFYGKWDKLKAKEWEEHCIGSKHMATIHFMRDRSWLWYIPLADKTLSLGFTYDKDYYKDGSPEEIFKKFLNEDKDLKEIVGDMSYEKFYHLPFLAYYSKKLYKPGLALVGDAAFFVDPLYSPGLELVCQQSHHLIKLLIPYFKNNKFSKSCWKKYEKLFLNAYDSRVFVYEKRYTVMKSYDVFTNWTQFDLLGYYLLHVIPSGFLKFRTFKPISLNPLVRFIYSFIMNFYVGVFLRREKKGIEDISLKKPVTFSRVNIPKLYIVPFRCLHIFYAWFVNFLRILRDELIPR